MCNSNIKSQWALSAHTHTHTYTECCMIYALAAAAHKEIFFCVHYVDLQSYEFAQKSLFCFVIGDSALFKKINYLHCTLGKVQSFCLRVKMYYVYVWTKHNNNSNSEIGDFCFGFWLSTVLAENMNATNETESFWFDDIIIHHLLRDRTEQQIATPSSFSACNKMSIAFHFYDQNRAEWAKRNVKKRSKRKVTKLTCKYSLNGRHLELEEMPFDAIDVVCLYWNVFFYSLETLDEYIHLSALRISIVHEGNATLVWMKVK